MTFGLGGNHGGTALTVTQRDEHNVAAHLFFRADEFDEAIAAAIKAAASRRDTEDVAQFTNSPGRYRYIEIVNPDAVRLVTVPAEPDEIPDLRWKYRCAIDNLGRELTSFRNPCSPEREAELYGEADSLRRRIIDAGYPVVDPCTRPYEDR